MENIEVICIGAAIVDIPLQPVGNDSNL
ncbi:hypothetical protein, partial [Klebsiella pneumoniae]